MTRAYWEFLVHGEKLQAPIPSTKEVQRVTRSCRTRSRHDESFSVARVRPRTSKGITDLLLLNLAWLNATCPSKKLARTALIRELFNRLESRSLSELTRQIAPPTKNGHAPPPTESRKSYQSVNLHGSLEQCCGSTLVSVIFTENETAASAKSVPAFGSQSRF